MGKKWGRNEDIHIGDIFVCWGSRDFYGTYFQVVALRGKTQVVLRAIDSESYINEGIAEDSPLFWRRERKRPLPGKFTERSALAIYELGMRGKVIRVSPEEITAWVLPDRPDYDRPWLQAVGPAYSILDFYFELERPEDWEPWDTETIRRMEEEKRQMMKNLFCKHRAGEEDAPCLEDPT